MSPEDVKGFQKEAARLQRIWSDRLADTLELTIDTLHLVADEVLAPHQSGLRMTPRESKVINELLVTAQLIQSDLPAEAGIVLASHALPTLLTTDTRHAHNLNLSDSERVEAVMEGITRELEKPTPVSTQRKGRLISRQRSVLGDQLRFQQNLPSIDIAESVRDLEISREVDVFTELDTETIRREVGLDEVEARKLARDAGLAFTPVYLLEEPEESVFRSDIRYQVQNLIQILPDNERELIQRQFGMDYEPADLAEVATSMQIEYEQARTLHQRAMRRLRNPLINYVVSDYKVK